MAQTKRLSLLETLLDVGTGYAIAVYAQALIFPMFDIEVTLSENFLMAGMFTIISIIRKYFFRRLFNSFESK